MAEKDKKAAEDEEKKATPAKKSGSKKSSSTKSESKKSPATEKKTASKKKADSKKEEEAEEKPAEKAASKKKADSKKEEAEEKPAEKAAPKKEEVEEKPAEKAAPKKEEVDDSEDEGDDVTIVDEDEEGAPVREHTPRIKPELDDETRDLLAKREQENRRRPAFQRQQWYYYKRLARTGWRHPTGQDSAQRRRFGYRPSVVKVGFRGPKEVRGLHPSGFEEVRVETLSDLDDIDPKSQAARVAAKIGKRKLKVIYEAADEKNIRILNRRDL